MAKKLALIDPDLLDRLIRGGQRDVVVPPPPPNLKRMSVLDDELRQVMEEDSLTDEERSKKYNHVLQRYQAYENKYDKEVHGRVHTLGKDIDKDSPSSAAVEKDIIAAIPPSFQRRAQLLLNRIKASGGKVGWTENGQLLLEGRPVPNTNIVDLVGDIVRRRKAVNPEGWREFAVGLRQLYIPQEVVGHPERWQYMMGAHKGQTQPPVISEKAEDTRTPHLSRSRERSHTRSRGRRRRSQSRSISSSSRWASI